MNTTNDTIMNLDQPIALRKRRRTSGGNVADNAEDNSSLPPPSKNPKTPGTRSRKRVRFSDSHLETARDRSTTGITPMIKRSRLSTPRKQSPPPGGSRQQSRNSRRQTLPARVNSDAIDMEFGSAPVEVQFVPLRQVLSPRTRRRIRRNGLSAEVNAIEADQRLLAKQEQRIEQLEQELLAARQEAEEAARAQRPSESFLRIAELENELEDAHDQIASQPDPAPMTSDDAYANDFDENQVVPRSPSPCPTLAFSDDENDEGIPTNDSPTARRSFNAVYTGMQTSVSPPPRSESQAQIAARTKLLVGARLEMEGLFPGETSLPLTPSPDADPTPLISALIKNLRTAKVDLSRTQRSLDLIQQQEGTLRAHFEKSLAKAEAAQAYATELNKAYQDTVDYARGHKARAERYRRNSVDISAQLQAAETQLQAAEDRIGELTEENEQYETGTDRLSQALKRCYNEIEDYKNLIMQMEGEHTEEVEKLKSEQLKAITELKSEIEKLKSEHLQTVAELESQVQTKTNDHSDLQKSFAGLQASFSGLESRLLESEAIKRKELEFHCKELQETVHAKQRMLRQIETRLENEQLSREQEVGRLNARLDQTQNRLRDLENDLKGEKQRTIDAIQRVVTSTWTTGDEAVRDVVASGEGYGLGLLTPGTDGGRFADVALSDNLGSNHVEGRVEMRRGKAAKKRDRQRRRHPDSGIGILEEEDETEPTQLLSSEL